MLALLEATILTASIYTIGLLTKRKMTIPVYIFLFFLFFLGAFFLGPSLHAVPPSAKTEIKHLQSYFLVLRGKLSKEDKKFYQDKVRFHQSNAERCYRDVKNKCAWLPDFDDRENAKFCLVTAGTLVAPADPMSKLIAITVELFVYYGLTVMDEWNYIKNKLHWAEYHYEMMEFYQELLQQEG